MISYNFFGIFLSFLAVLFGVISGVFVKVLSSELHLLTILSYRFLFSLPVIYLVAFYFRRSKWLEISDKKVLSIRIIVGLSGIFFWFLSLKYVPLGQATAIFLTSVLFVTILSPFLLKEKIGIIRWCAVIIGLIGVFVITGPFSKDIKIEIIFPLVGSLCGAGLYISLRKLGKSDEPVTVACWYNSVGFILTTLLYFFLEEQIIELYQIYILVALGISASVVQLCLTTSYKYSEAVVVSTIRYFQIPMAGILGYFMFSEQLTYQQVLGTVLIFVSCLFIVWREYNLSNKKI